uniref:CCDC92/74 N-terminal domain-containing protein n=1 Tax=Aotus nancymaae TaxID=37293 RepID=A0A2K5CTN6_AOTNA
MAATNLENQLHNAQKNLLFLQQEHASMLKGLHAEIRRLQQHCTDLTYELTLKNPNKIYFLNLQKKRKRKRKRKLDSHSKNNKNKP